MVEGCAGPVGGCPSEGSPGRDEEVAALVHGVTGAGSRILDAGCGPGGVAAVLAGLGHRVMGVDADLEVLRAAAEKVPQVPFWMSDLAELDVPQAAVAGGFDVVLLADVVPRLQPGSVGAVMGQLRGVCRPGGLIVAGLAADPGTVAEYEGACRAAGLVSQERWSGWSGAAFGPGSRYLVSMHSRPVPQDRVLRSGWWSRLFGPR
ncbi:class I SAM-dependent methyltransferase [Austwickia chelonae]|uniref:class I SAM-dependent methyltransferase n=1 Tax=Austwickia chelonae TaxID=100225 RepID=UPI000E2732CF|nr:class I SAM-dependent methyltransferase [Austwickia chelonae]